MGGGYSQFCRCSSQRSEVIIYITAGKLICITQRLMKNVLKDCERPKPLAQNIIITFFSSLRKEKKNVSTTVFLKCTTWGRGSILLTYLSLVMLQFFWLGV